MEPHIGHGTRNMCKLESHSCFSVLPPHDKGNAGRIHDHCKLCISITLFKRTRFVGTAYIFCFFVIYRFLLARHKAAIELYNEATKLSDRDWVKFMYTSSDIAQKLFRTNWYDVPPSHCYLLKCHSQYFPRTPFSITYYVKLHLSCYTSHTAICPHI